MYSPNHYTRAPIIEALIDLQVEPSPDTTLPILRGIHRKIDLDYPVYEDIIQGVVQAAPDISITATQSLIGCRFLSSDKKLVFQVRLDGFSLSRLAPYENWESLRNEAKRLWELYQPIAKPKSVNRVAIRYINRLDFPLPCDFKDYLRTVPEVSPDLPQGLSEYAMQLVIPQEDMGAWLSLREGIIPNAANTGKFVSVLLDIDLFCEEKFSPDDSSFWDLLERFRVRKNLVFEACITDNTRGLIE